MTETATRRPEICVAGLVYFEVHLPADGLPNEAGVERFVDALPVTAGGALNSASVAAALGRRTQIAYPSGEGLTDAAIRGEMQHLELSSTTWRTDADPAVTVVVGRDGDRSFLSAADFDALGACPELPVADWIHVPGLREAAALEASLRGARRRGARISVAGSWAPRRLDALTEPSERPWDLFVLNRKEYEHIADSERVDPEHLAHVAEDVVVTGVDGGVVARLDGTEYRIETRRVEPVDTTGAGDAFCAGFLDARLADAPPTEALSHGARVAARTVEQHGGVVTDPRRFEDLEGFGA